MEKNKTAQIPVRPIFKKLLVIAIAAYVIGSCIIQADLCYRLGEMEHTVMHLSSGCHH